MQSASQVSYHPNPNPKNPARDRNNQIKVRCLVYTAAGFNHEQGGSYPVVYLLHGVGDVEFSWEVHGHVSAILDELVKDELIQPMIVVMPFGFPSEEEKRQRQFPDKTWFDGYLEHVIDEVEHAYRIEVGNTARGRHVRRAVTGLSMGGKQALEFGLGHLQMVSAIGSLSAAIQKRATEHALPGLLATCEQNQAQIRDLSLFYHAWGKDDETGKKDGQRLIDANKHFVAELHRLGIRHVWRELEGRHDWGVWKACLREFLPLLASSWR